MAMTRRKVIMWWIIGGVVVLGAAAVAFGPYLYRDLTTKDNPSAPTVDLQAASGDELTDIASTWRAANGSYAGYRVDELLRGVSATVVGRTDQVSGELTATETTVTAGRITVDIASVATNISSRDDYFRKNTMHTDQYPTAVFELTSPITVTTPMKVGSKETFQVTGKLTIHGATKDVTAQLETGFDGTNVQVAGSIPITFADYNVTAPDLGFVTVEKTGHIELLIKFEKQS